MAILTTDTNNTLSERTISLNRILKSYRSKIARYTQSGSGFSLDAVMGCEREALGDWIESKFQEGMSWKNYGDWWLTNMESPVNYDMTNIEQFLSYFNYQSFSPKWKEEVKSPFGRKSENGLPILKQKQKQ